MIESEGNILGRFVYKKLLNIGDKNNFRDKITMLLKANFPSDIYTIFAKNYNLNS